METLLNTQLEIFIPTYNRKEPLRRTLMQLMAPNSPVREMPITVLDNASTDGSSELIEEFASQYPNIKHIRHHKNIGGNANIARAFELGSACGSEYVWVICDDDSYDFSNWAECEKYLSSHVPAVVVANYVQPEKGIAYLFKQLSFVPAAIYRADLITGDVLQNMYFNISNMFPQLAVAAAAINSGPSLPVLAQPLVTMCLNPGNDSYTRGAAKLTTIHPLLKEMYWSKGYLNSIPLLSSSRYRNQCCFHASAETDCFYNFCAWYMVKGNGLLYTYVCGIHQCSGWAKVAFALLAPLAVVCSFYRDKKGLNILLFGRIKTRIWKFKTY